LETTVAIVEDNSNLLEGLVNNLSLYEDIEVLFTAKNGIDLFTKLEKHAVPKVILMDIEMPQMNGILATVELYKRYKEDVKIIILTVFDQNDKIFEAIQAGACGYLMKDEKPIAIVNAINEAMAGGSPMSSIIATKILGLLRDKKEASNDAELENYPIPTDFDLTKRELEILQFLSKGLLYKQIAELLFVSDKTIKKHVENIYRKLHVNSRYEAMKFAEKYKWIT
jgi:DNA-binding NarL/FixJ family response regulator